MSKEHPMLFHVYVSQDMWDHFKNKAIKGHKSLSAMIREDLETVIEVDKDLYEED